MLRSVGRKVKDHCAYEKSSLPRHPNLFYNLLNCCDQIEPEIFRHEEFINAVFDSVSEQRMEDLFHFSLRKPDRYRNTLYLFCKINQIPIKENSDLIIFNAMNPEAFKPMEFKAMMDNLFRVTDKPIDNKVFLKLLASLKESVSGQYSEDTDLYLSSYLSPLYSSLSSNKEKIEDWEEIEPEFNPAFRKLCRAIENNDLKTVEEILELNCLDIRSIEKVSYRKIACQKNRECKYTFTFEDNQYDTFITPIQGALLLTTNIALLNKWKEPHLLSMQSIITLLINHDPGCIATLDSKGNNILYYTRGLEERFDRFDAEEEEILVQIVRLVEKEYRLKMRGLNSIPLISKNYSSEHFNQFVPWMKAYCDPENVEFASFERKYLEIVREILKVDFFYKDARSNFVTGYVLFKLSNDISLKEIDGKDGLAHIFQKLYELTGVDALQFEKGSELHSILSNQQLLDRCKSWPMMIFFLNHNIAKQKEYIPIFLNARLITPLDIIRDMGFDPADKYLESLRACDHLMTISDEEIEDLFDRSFFNNNYRLVHYLFFKLGKENKIKMNNRFLKNFITAIGENHIIDCDHLDVNHWPLIFDILKQVINYSPCCLLQMNSKESNIFYFLAMAKSLSSDKEKKKIIDEISTFLHEEINKLQSCYNKWTTFFYHDKLPQDVNNQILEMTMRLSLQKK